MSYSIPSSTKILTLTTAPFLFILVGAQSVSQFAMVPGVYILLWPQESEVHSSFWRHRYTHSAAQLSKSFKPLSVTIFLWQGHCWIGEKTQTRNLTVFIALVIWRSRTLKFLFVFDFNQCLNNLFLKGSSANNFRHA